MNDNTRVTPAALQALANKDLENFFVAVTPGGIEAQEASEQKSFVGTETLPKECPRKELFELGFQFGDEYDDIFIKVKFPDGWAKVATDHSMWSDLVDDKGRKRGGIFYKGAFYDRSSHMNLSKRFRVMQNYDASKENIIKSEVLDGEDVVFTSTIFTYENPEDISYVDNEAKRQAWLTIYNLEDNSRKECINWLEVNYPDYENTNAYWDE